MSQKALERIKSKFKVAVGLGIQGLLAHKAIALFSPDYFLCGEAWLDLSGAGVPEGT